jgi:hypothetical protein
MMSYLIPFLFFLILSFAVWVQTNFFKKQFNIQNKILWWMLLIILWAVAVVPSFYYRLSLRDPAETKWIMNVHYYSIGILSSYLFFIILFKLSFLFYQKFYKKNSAQFSPERRDLLTRQLAMGITMGSAIYGGGRHLMVDLGVKEVLIPLKNWQESFSNLKIVQLSDLHIGPTLQRSFILSVVEKVNALKPDMIVITGDLVDGRVDLLKYHLLPLFDLQAPYGKYFVTGNHEYYWGISDWLSFIPQLGFKVLSNEHQMIPYLGSKILLGGVPDFSMGQQFGTPSDPEKSIANAPLAHLKILLAHQPKNCVLAKKAGYDLQLSGHTHAGQYFPWTWLIHFFHPYVKGLNDHLGMWVYVNAGTGLWGPLMRTDEKSEITFIRFIKSSQS